MTKTELSIFNRVYQSYVMGGDTYTFAYKTEDITKIDNFKSAIKSLEDKNLVNILFQSDKKTRMAITDDGIAYGNTIIDQF